MNRLAQCIELTRPHPTAGLLLYRLTYWYDRAQTEFDGRNWVINPREWWMEQTGLTRHQYDHATNFLKSKDLVLTRHAASPFHRNMQRVSWITLTSAALEALYSGVQSSGMADDQSSGSPDDYKTLGLAIGKTPEMPKKSVGAYSAADAMKHLPEKPKLKAEMPAWCFEKWRTAMTAAGFKFADSSMKQKRFAKLIYDKIGDDMDTVLDEVVPNWSQYLEFLDDAKYPLKNVSKVPDLLTVLKTLEKAMMFAQTAKKPPPVEEAEIKIKIGKL